VRKRINAATQSRNQRNKSLLQPPWRRSGALARRKAEVNRESNSIRTPRLILFEAVREFAGNVPSASAQKSVKSE